MKAIVIIGLLLIATPAMAQDFAIQRLEASPRHQESVEIPVSEGRQLRGFLVYPEKAEKSSAVLVIHENRGLTDWVRSFADQLASQGYLVFAPDLLSDFDDARKRTTDFANSDAARDAIYQLNPEQVTRDLEQARRFLTENPAANGKVAVVGFCWGGGQSFRFATNAPDLAAAFVFYGPPPAVAAVARISAPVYGFYAENDERINASLPEITALMSQEGKVFEPEVYAGAGHAFMRSGDDPAGSLENKQARDQAWQRLISLLKIVLS